MKVLHILYRATVGGTERTVYNLIKQQYAKGYDVSCLLLCSGGDFLPQFQALLNERLFQLEINTVKGIFSLFAFLKRLGKDCLIHNHVRNLKLGFCLKFVKNRKILTEHLLTDKLKNIDHASYRKLKSYYRLYARDYDAITGVSSAVKTALVDDFQLPEAKVFIIHNGLENGFLANTSDKSEFIVGNATHFEKIKNIDLFLAIAKSVVRKSPDVKFCLIGDGGQRESIKSFIRTRKLENNVLLLPASPDLTPFFANLQLGLITSHSETFSLFAAECLLRGIPVVASAVGGLTEVVEDKKCGYLIDNENIEKFVERILYLKNNKTAYNDFSQRARAYSQKFLIQNIAEEYEGVYSKLASR